MTVLRFFLGQRYFSRPSHLHLKFVRGNIDVPGNDRLTLAGHMNRQKRRMSQPFHESLDKTWGDMLNDQEGNRKTLWELGENCLNDWRSTG